MALMMSLHRPLALFTALFKILFSRSAKYNRP